MFIEDLAEYERSQKIEDFEEDSRLLLSLLFCHDG